MGLHKVDKCIFTDLPVTNFENGDLRDAIEYVLKIENYTFFIRLPFEAQKWKDNAFFKKNNYLFQGLLYNNNWVEEKDIFITLEKLKELLNRKTFPITPQQKADSLFQSYLNMQLEDGERVNTNLVFNEVQWKKQYLKSNNELIYYTRHLTNQGLINSSITDYINNLSVLNYFSITVEGLNYGIRLNTEGENSNLCFIAMSFKPETIQTRIAIKDALTETGFQPIIIDEQNIDSAKTINDEIIASLKKCRFCISDFSYHSNGVYFESGFALGQGKKVIYTCQEDEFQNAHFDIRPLQHIIYKTSDQLKKELIHKIEAWIK